MEKEQVKISKTFYVLLILILWPLLVEAQNLKVITLNTYLLCVGPKCVLREVPQVEERKKEIARFLKAQNAELVFLQEVWQPGQYEYLKKEAGYPYAAYFGETSELALLSRFPLSNIQYIPTSWQGSHSEDCKKGVVGYRYGLGLAQMDYQGEKILLAITHPIARRSEVAGFAKPADQLTPERLILELDFWRHLKDKMDAGPFIFAGDFNMNPDSVEYFFFNTLFDLTDTLKQIAGDTSQLCSYCRSNQWAQEQKNPAEGVIDYIFVNDFFDVDDATIDFPKPDLSDHQPVEAILELKETHRTGGPVPVRRSLGEGGWPPKKGQPQGVAPTNNEIDPLIRYIENVSLSSYCYLSYEMGWRQKKRTIEFLEKIKNETE